MGHDNQSGPAAVPPSPSASNPQSAIRDSQSEDELLRWRSEFPILEKTVYLISNSLVAMPRAVYDSLKEYADTWADRGVRAWAESWWEMAVRLGDLMGPILGTRPGEVSFHQNVTLAEAIILSCFEFKGKRRKIVYTDMEFPSVMYLYQAQQERNAEICIVKSDDGIGAGIRISPHFYTSDAELEAVVLEIRAILDSRAYEKHIGAHSYVT